MNSSTARTMITLLVFIITASIPSVMAQDVKGTIFNPTLAILDEANRAQAEILSPENYEKGMKLFREADNDYNRGRKLSDIRKKLVGAEAYFRKALQTTKLADVTFVSLVKARADAGKAEAESFSTEIWVAAEEKFREAALKLEGGDVNGARKRADEAEKLYRDAELAAIKANYLNDTRALLERAVQNKVDDRAPKTLQNARELVGRAEKELEENRYDKDVARSLARQAKYEAKHAIYLSRVIREMKKNKETEEDLLLRSEVPLQTIAANIDVVAEFDAGYQKVTDQIVQHIRDKDQENEHLAQGLADRDQQIADFLARISELEAQLGTIADEQSELKQQMEARERVRQQFATIEKMFNREEANVFRQSNDVILRLVGLNFASGRADIEPKYFTLLAKVEKAINTFPDCRLIIEGHTDSYGSDQRNLELSRERAQAVRQYLLANLVGLDYTRIESVGYGESKPIANNETREGRTKNRRIDVVIIPQLSAIGSRP